MISQTEFVQEVMAGLRAESAGDHPAGANIPGLFTDSFPRRVPSLEVE